MSAPGSMIRVWPVAPLAAFLVLFAMTGARAQPLVADLSDHLVAITTGFTGTEVLLFGAIDEDGDVVIVVRGPEVPLLVRRKARIAGVWVNRDEARFAGAPAFYAVASNRPIADIAPHDELVRNQIGVENLALEVTGVEDEALFREAFIRNKRRDDLYSDEPGKVSFLTGRLFRTDIYFPANVPVGTYTVQVFLVRDGEVVGAQTTPLVISKVGVGAEIFLFANRHSALYGLLAIVFALMAGWVASAVFRKA
jgi:uncharacterized protein (TIGR02186 family)